MGRNPGSIFRYDLQSTSVSLVIGLLISSKTYIDIDIDIHPSTSTCIDMTQAAQWPMEMSPLMNAFDQVRMQIANILPNRAASEDEQLSYS